MPLFVVVANSFRELPEITRNGLIAVPHSFSLKAWPQAWAHYCVAGTCEGIKRNFYNSLIMTIPATIASTLLGALNGYVLSKWRFPGSETLFVCILLGVFMPGQIALLPWAYILGNLHLSNSVYGLILVHVIQGISFTTLFCRNYYVNIPDDLIKAARIDGAGFWRIFHENHPSPLAAHPHRRPSSGSSPASGTNFCSASCSPAEPSSPSPRRWSRSRPVR